MHPALCSGRSGGRDKWQIYCLKQRMRAGFFSSLPTSVLCYGNFSPCEHVAKALQRLMNFWMATEGLQHGFLYSVSLNVYLRRAASPIGYYSKTSAWLGRDKRGPRGFYTHLINWQQYVNWVVACCNRRLYLSRCKYCQSISKVQLLHTSPSIPN